ncbi:3,4-dihydroxy-2-butanone-4-phosphate synthase [Mycobacterium sp. 21AC1]|nr:3,4-dihydroxy-2-butanone-4-phosphate synthase [Mycobacterium sp. 21AC1]
MVGLCDVEQTIDSAANALNAGRPVLIVRGGPGREAADILISAALASPRWTAWAVRYTSGLLCVTLRSTRADELDLPAMVRGNGFSEETPSFGVGVDAAAGIGTGISATDRAHTARVLASSQTGPEDLSRPGHILPLRTAPRGVIERRAGAEAAVDLCEIAGLPPAGLTATLLADGGDLLQGVELSAFARAECLPMVRVEDVVHHRLHHGDGRRGRVRQTATRIVDVPDRSMRVVDFTDELTGAEHTVFVGSLTRTVAPTAYIVSECPHRDPLSADCGCRQEFETRRARIADEGGVIVYLRSSRVPAEKYSVQEHELAQGCITAMLVHLGISGALVSGWPDGGELTDYRTAASL